MRKLWPFEVEMKLRCYFKKVNESQNQIVNSWVTTACSYTCHGVVCGDSPGHVLNVEGHVAEGGNTWQNQRM